MFGFVILHYLAYEMTEQCVENLLNRFQDCTIVIVDNASQNGSGKKLVNRFSKAENVHVVLNDHNEGFARGNNIGYSYLRDNFECDYIVIMNNDVLIYDDDFLNKIEKIYLEDDFHILGPDIYVRKKDWHQSPTRVNGKWDMDRLDAYITKLEKKVEFYHLDTPYKRVKRKSKKICKRMLRIGAPAKPKPPVNNKHYCEKLENPMLHGACYIFSSKFIKAYDRAFNPNTFMFMEEDILWYEAYLRKLKIIYSPIIQVEHLEDVSTDVAYKTEYKKDKMKTNEALKSAKVLKQLMQENE